MLNSLLKPVVIILTFFVILFTYTKLAGPIPFSVNSVTTSKSDTFNVSGEGKVTVTPDVAIVNLGITSTGASVKQTQDQINGVINKVSTEVKKLGINENDIQTTNYSINPNFDFTSGTQRITGYSANASLNIRVREIDKVNNVIDVATSSGANQISNITFDVDDKSKAQEEARELAVAEARKKAEAASRMVGFTLGRIINYSENFDGVIPPSPVALKAIDGRGGGGGTSVEPGSSEIRVLVTLSYEIN